MSGFSISNLIVFSFCKKSIVKLLRCALLSNCFAKRDHSTIQPFNNVTIQSFNNPTASFTLASLAPKAAITVSFINLIF